MGSTDFTHFKPTKKLKNVVDIYTALSGAIKSEHQIHYKIYQAVSVQEKRDVLLLYGALWTPVFIGFLQSVIHHQYWCYASITSNMLLLSVLFVAVQCIVLALIIGLVQPTRIFITPRRRTRTLDKLHLWTKNGTEKGGRNFTFISNIEGHQFRLFKIFLEDHFSSIKDFSLILKVISRFRQLINSLLILTIKTTD